MERNRDARETPEVVLDFQGLLRSGIVSFARGADCVVGLSNSREGASMFCDQIVPVNSEAHAVDQNLAMVRALGVSFSAEDVQFPLPGGEPLALESSGSVPSRFILLHPWSRGEGKSLSPAVLQAFCDALRELPVLIVGMHASPPPLGGSHVVDLTNKTSLPQLLWLMRRAAACISVDSGPMHMAAAVNPRTLGIHTWSDPRKVGPYPASAWVWKAGRIAHRGDFNSAECAVSRAVAEADARGMADFVFRTMLAA
jgi:ADP-heptose:LPS heptosyltransferase